VLYFYVFLSYDGIMFKDYVIDLQSSVLNKESNAYLLDLPRDFMDETTTQDQNLILVYVDNQLLTKSNTQHQEIRLLGDGRYSIWNSQLYFSLPSNQHINSFKVITLRLVNKNEFSFIENEFLNYIGSREDKIQAAISINAGLNNSLFKNFYSSHNKFLDFIVNHLDIEKIETVCVAGVGYNPYSALRFIADGAQLVYANDLTDVKKNFSSVDIKILIKILRQLNPIHATRLENNINLGQDFMSTFNNLIVIDKIPFEEINCAQKCDLVYSSSVLEHVKNIYSFYENLRDITNLHGYSYHYIDLRDHRYFAKPLEFLKLSEKEYGIIATENRLRSIDHLNYLRDFGFEIIDTEFEYISPVGYTDIDSEITRVDSVKNYDDIPEVLTELDLLKLDVKFQSYPRRELGIIGITVLAKKSNTK